MADKPYPLRLTWRNQPHETGLHAVGAGPRGRIGSIRIEARKPPVDVACVQAIADRYGSWNVLGWFWYARADNPPIALMNTAHEPCATKEEAQAQATAYIKACLANPDPKEP